MKTLNIYAAPYTLSQVNKKDDGTLKTQKETTRDNILSAIDHFDTGLGEDTNFILIATREKLEGGDFRYSISMTYLDHEADLIDMKISLPVRTPAILISDDNDISRTIKRAVDNIVLS
jgi:hypothetical protein